MTSLQGVVLGLLIGLSVGSGGAWYVQGLRSDDALAKQTQQYDGLVSKAKDDGIAEGQRQARAVADVAEEGRKANEKVNFNAAVNAGATDSLRITASVFAAAATCDPGPARRGTSATRAAMVLSELLTKSNQRASDLAKTADDARARGLTCEATYMAIKPPGK